MQGIPELSLLLWDCCSELSPQDGCHLSHALQSLEHKAPQVNHSGDIFLSQCQGVLSCQRIDGEARVLLQALKNQGRKKQSRDQILVLAETLGIPS